MTAKDALRQWIIDYLRSKDTLTRHITDIKENAGIADVLIEGGKPQAVFVQPELKDIPPDLGRHTVLVTLNTRQNLDFLIQNWDVLCSNPHLCAYFVNPDSKLEHKWVIFPATHNKIIERKTLRQGLEALFATVEPVSEQPPIPEPEQQS